MTNVGICGKIILKEGDFLKRKDFQEASAYCECGCTRLVATRYDWGDYDVRMESANVRYNCNSIKQRIVDSFKVLFGKCPTHAEVSFVSKEDFKAWLDDCVGILK